MEVFQWIDNPIPLLRRQHGGMESGGSIVYTQATTTYPGTTGVTLRSIVTNVISRHPGRQAVKELVEFCHALAIAYLRRRAACGSFKADLLGLRLEDVAFDCIADLFRTSEEGLFHELARYYSSVAYESLDDDALAGMTRRLVFSKVTSALHRQYREIDPALHKVLRNLKATVRLVEGVSLENAGNDWLLHFSADAHGISQLPLMPPEILEAHLAASIAYSSTTRGILLAVREALEEQSLYSRSYPLLSFALALRAAYARFGDEPIGDVDHSVAFAEDEVEAGILTSLDRVRSAMRHTYVETGKVEEDLYFSYLRTAADILRSEFIGNGNADGGYYEHLLMHVPDLTRENYRDYHRGMLEYIVRLIRQDFLKEMKKNL
jgi:hypothetical protein